jgi:predicted metal-dependent phosphoesterase TrpH
LEYINHYLTPIVDEFLELWRGWRISKTHQYPDSLDIKTDIPATQKLFGHGSAVIKCNRCEKHSTYSEKYKKTYYGEDHNYEISTTESHRKYA